MAEEQKKTENKQPSKYINPIIGYGIYFAAVIIIVVIGLIVLLGAAK